MSEPAADKVEKPARKKGLLIPVALTAVLGGAGFASTFLGYWSPMSFLGSAEAKTQTASSEPAVVFVDIPRVQLTIPASPPRVLLLSAKIEADQADQAQIQHLMPRVSDAFNTFLSEIDPAAFDKRGVLEVIRAELVTRSRFVLGEKPVKDLLITEFLLQ